jgi:hypothetical protein
MKTIEECRQQWGADVIVTESMGHQLVSRKARGRELRRFLASTQMGSAKGHDLFDAMEEIAKTCCVSHTPQELDDLLDQHPLIFEVIGGSVLDASKESLEALGKGSRTAGKKR